MSSLCRAVLNLDPFRPDRAPEGLSQTERRFFRTSLALLLLLAGLGIVSQVAQHYGLGRVPYSFHLATAGFDLITNSGFLGIALCYNRLRTSTWDQAAIVALGLSFESVLWMLRPADWGLAGRLMGLGLGLGLAATVGLAAQALAGEPGLRLRARGYLAIAVFLMLFPAVTLWAHFVVMEWNPQVYDLFAFQVDGLPGFQPSFAVGAFLGAHPLLLSLALLVYNELPLLLILAVFQVIDHADRAYNNVIASFAGMGLAGFLLYNLYPAVGLGVLCPESFPQGPTPDFPGEPFLLDLQGPRNCMPSLHMSWILCIFFAVFRIRRAVLVAALGVVGFTVLSTLYLGHYWIDLVAAFPLALVFQERTAHRTMTNGPARRAALLGGLSLLGLTLASLRWFHPWLVASPALTLTAEAGIILTCLALERRMARATLAGHVSRPAETKPQACPATA
jgi:hypothetical protein